MEPPKTPRTRRIRVLIVAGILIVTLAFAFFTVPFMAYREWAFVSENTGSRKGYREWFFGLRTRHWYKRSTIENFVATNGPVKFEHRWTSYAGTGYDIYGLKVLYGHGRPGPISRVPQDVLNKWFDALTQKEKVDFCILLNSTNKDALRTTVDKIWDWEIEAAQNR